jgi:hypothetical protein
VVDLDEPLQIPFGDRRVGAEVPEVSGAVGEPPVELDDGLGVGGDDRAQVRRGPSLARTSASQCLGYCASSTTGSGTVRASGPVSVIGDAQSR